MQIGRPAIYRLAAKGEYGVRKVIQMLKDELEPMLLKELSALKRKGLLEPRRKAQSASMRLIDVKRTFKKKKLKN